MARAAPTGPAAWFEPPVKVAAGGFKLDMVGLDPLLLRLLTTRDGHGVLADIGGLLRVTMTSGAGPVGHAVPQAAVTVEVCFV